MSYMNFHKVDPNYAQYLINMGVEKQLNEQDKVRLNDSLQPYLGPVFFKDSSDNQRLKFYVPCVLPEASDYKHDGNLDIDSFIDSKSERKHRTGINGKEYRILLSDNNWGKKRDFNVVMGLQLSHIIPIPDEALLDFDTWNDFTIPEGLTNEEEYKGRLKMHDRFECVEKLLDNSDLVEVIRDTCINFQGEKTFIEMGQFVPEDYYLEEDAKEYRNIYEKTGVEAIKTEASCVCYESNDYKKIIDSVNSKDSIKNKLEQNKLITKMNNTKSDIKNLAIKAKNASYDTKQAPEFYIK